MVEGNTNESKRLANTLYSWVNRLLVGDSKTIPMTTSEAVRIIEQAGMSVVFTDGAWLVTLWTGCTEKMTRRDLIALATDFEYITK
jgi:hypothetical protein